MEILYAVLALICVSAIVVGVRAVSRIHRSGRDDDDAFGPRR